jgi:hypothetical protein
VFVCQRGHWFPNEGDIESYRNVLRDACPSDPVLVRSTLFICYMHCAYALCHCTCTMYLHCIVPPSRFYFIGCGCTFRFLVHVVNLALIKAVCFFFLFMCFVVAYVVAADSKEKEV